jgi:hypothetical protein
VSTPAKRLRAIRKGMEGEIRVLHGRLHRTRENDPDVEFGRIKVVDLEVASARTNRPAFRLVDTRSITELVVEGVLYHVNAVVHRGVPLLTAAAPYLPGMANIDFASGSPFVSVMLDEDDLKRRLQAMSDRVIEVLGLVDGVTHMECFVTAEGEIVFCEIAARPGGGGIVGMIEAQYGVNFARAALLLEAGFGERVMPPSQPAPDTLAGLIGFRLPRSGFLRRVPAAIDFGDDWIRAVTIDHEPGGFIAAAAHCTDFVGSFVFVARDRGHFDERRVELTQRFNKALEVEPV